MAGAALAAPYAGHSGATAVNPRVAGAAPPFGSWCAYFMPWHRSRTRPGEHTPMPSAGVSDYRRVPETHQYWRERRGGLPQRIPRLHERFAGRIVVRVALAAHADGG